MVKIDIQYCKGCNICVAICPVSVYAEGEAASPRGYIIPHVKDPQKCVDNTRIASEKKKCELCIYVCPDQAITWGND